MNIISAIVRVSQQGVSRPYVCRDGLGALYWCKGNHTGLRAVMSEWICARVARSLGLPVPECQIMKLDVSYFRSWCDCNVGDFPRLVTDANQYVFASKHVEDAKDVICAAADLHDADQRLLARIKMFDARIRNMDRTAVNSNLLVNGGVHVIDHNNAFDAAFDRETFDREHVLTPLVTAVDRQVSVEFERKFDEVVTEDFLDSVWSEMPAEWTDPGEVALPLAMVKEFLLGGART